jgi:hypothetical protein
MELAGEEKRIRALFSELRLEDQIVAPSFDRLWNSARTTQPHRIVFMQPLAVLGALAMIAVVFALGSRLPEPGMQEIAEISLPVVLPPVGPRAETPKKSEPRSRRAVHRRSVRVNEPQHVVIQQAEVLASWQSPTVRLMAPAAGSFLSSLPELTESVKDLESYLSINDVKELKQ